MGLEIKSYRLAESKSFLDMLSSASAEHGFQVGRGLGQTLVEGQNAGIEMK
jgi:hypothetical protein